MFKNVLIMKKIEIEKTDLEIKLENLFIESVDLYFFYCFLRDFTTWYYSEWNFWDFVLNYVKISNKKLLKEDVIKIFISPLSVSYYINELINNGLIEIYEDVLFRRHFFLVGKNVDKSYFWELKQIKYRIPNVEIYKLKVYFNQFSENLKEWIFYRFYMLVKWIIKELR